MVFSLINDRQTNSAGGVGKSMALLRDEYRVNNPLHPCPTTSYNIFPKKTIDFGCFWWFLVVFDG
jgi:hypothetical protein